jgi:hypothetical protein
VSEWKLAALTYFDPKFATTQGIIDVLNLLEVASGDHIDVVLHGYQGGPPEWIDRRDLVQVRVGKREMYYDPQRLMNEVARVQSQTTWTFSLEIDVILVRQRQHYFGDGGFERDYSQAIVINLYRLLKDEKITSYVSFFSELITFARDYNGDSPAWDFSDHKLWQEAKRSLFEAFKAYLGFKKFQGKVEDYAIQNIIR